jgi:type II secretory pathway predicted ATPase ExeA
MYQTYFAMREEPFGVSPDCRFFYQSEQHREALATLYYAIEQRRGFALLVGRAGLGKTSILVQLMQAIKSKAEVAYLPHPYFDRSTVLDSILLSLGLSAGPSLAQNCRLFYEYLVKLRLSGRTCVVVIDEAQDLDRDTLEAIRLLSNFETPTEKLLQIVLAGQPRLAETLGQPECEQLRQRLNLVARLQPLSTREVYDYLAHRLKTAGSSADLFAPSAVETIAERSGGVPRNVNTICFNSLTLAYALNHSQVRREDVEEALRDLDLKESPASMAPTPAPAEGRETQAAAIDHWPQTGYLNFQQPARSFRPVLIAAGVTLLTVGAFFFRNLTGAL